MRKEEIIEHEINLRNSIKIVEKLWNIKYKYWDNREKRHIFEIHDCLDTVKLTEVQIMKII